MVNTKPLGLGQVPSQVLRELERHEVRIVTVRRERSVFGAPAIRWPASVILSSTQHGQGFGDVPGICPFGRVERGHWRAVCQCGLRITTSPSQTVFGSTRSLRRLARHLPQCDFVAATDPAVLRVLLKVKDVAGRDYWWVECGACDTAWQVPH
jgi:hypothetical protein